MCIRDRCRAIDYLEAGNDSMAREVLADRMEPSSDGINDWHGGLTDCYEDVFKDILGAVFRTRKHCMGCNKDMDEEQESKSVSNIGSVAIDLLESDNDSENDRAFGNGNNQLSTTDNDSTSSNTKTPVPKFVTIGRGSDAFVEKKQGRKATKRKQ